MQKLRIRYAKRGCLRFTSHRDVARTFERALRRAGVPMAYSQGFNPRPKVSWIGASPTGTASEAEYVEIQLVDAVSATALARELDAALPPGLDVLEAVESTGGSLADRIDACVWRIELPGVDTEELARAVESLLAATEVRVQKLTKDGRKEIDARPAVVSAHVVREVEPATTLLGDGADSAGQCGILITVVRQTQPVVRPDDVFECASRRRRPATPGTREGDPDGSGAARRQWSSHGPVRQRPGADSGHERLTRSRGAGVGPTRRRVMTCCLCARVQRLGDRAT